MTQAQLKDKCYALALSGGANKGAYQAGVIYGMAHILPEEDLLWDVVAGVSTGALNAGGISVWPIEKPREMSEWLVNLWMNMTNDQIYVKWPLGYVQGLYSESGIYDTTPLLNFVTRILN